MHQTDGDYRSYSGNQLRCLLTISAMASTIAVVFVFFSGRFYPWPLPPHGETEKKSVSCIEEIPDETRVIGEFS